METFGRVVATVMAVSATLFGGLMAYTMVSLFAHEVPELQIIGRVVVVLLTWFVGRWFWKLIWKRDTSDT